jgi:peptide/nickel transport system permease protein
MARFLVRSTISTIVTILFVSIVLFGLLDAIGSERVINRVLGVFATAEQKESFKNQLALDEPIWIRYSDWLLGNDWRASRHVGYPLVTVANPSTGEAQWWAEVDGQFMRWRLEGEDLVALVRQENGSTVPQPANEFWQTDGDVEIFWGVDTQNRVVQWQRGGGEAVFVITSAGLRQEGDGPRDYIPLRKGIVRLDPGISSETRRPVAATLLPRLRNTLILAGLAFLFIMPLALLLGIIAGINEGKLLDRVISISSLAATATPEFVTGIFLILIFGIWLDIVPAVALFPSADAIFEEPSLLILPLLTLTAVELGYIVRMTRASMVEVMSTSYIRTAIIKGMPYRRVVFRHAIRNALMAPITIMMLHVNYLVGGVVVVEAIFGYPGLGKYIYDSAVASDTNAVIAAAMVTVIIAIATRLIGDLAYTYLNPRIRYA